jgi:hypothetical protein
LGRPPICDTLKAVPSYLNTFDERAGNAGWARSFFECSDLNSLGSIMTDTHYTVLGASRTASAAEIRAAYLKLIQQVHPDLIANAPEFWRKQAEEKTKDINGAYDVLSNPDKRRVYDLQLDASRQAEASQERAASQSQRSTTVNTQSQNQASTGGAKPPPSQTVSPQAQGAHAQASSSSTATRLTICVIIVVAICALANLPKRNKTTNTTESARSMTPITTEVANQVTTLPTPTIFGNASCSGRPELGDYRLVNGESRSVRNNNLYNLKATLSSQPQDEDGYRIFGTQDQSAEEIAERIRRDELTGRNTSEVRTCDLFNGDPSDNSALNKSSIRDAERLEVLGRSAEFDGVDHGAAWYKVRTEHAGEGYLEYRAIRCDGAPESCKCGGDLSSCQQLATAAPPLLKASGALTFSNLSVGDKPSQVAALGTPAVTGTYKSYVVQKWNLANGNDLSITLDGAGRIVYMESDWGGNAAGRESDFQGLVFGVTTLSDLRKQLGSNGFAFKERSPLTEAPDGVVMVNSFEVGNNVVTFFTKVTSDSSSFSTDRAKLVAISMADPEYAKIEWGDRIYDPNYRKVEWKQ